MVADDIPDWVKSEPNPKHPGAIPVFDGRPTIEGVEGKQIFLHAEQEGELGIFPGTNAVVALILSIVGLLVCNIITAIPALILSYQSLKITKNYPDHPEHGVARAAMVISWITVIIGIIMAAIILFFWGIIVSSYGL